MTFDPLTFEPEILSFWKSNQIIEKSREKNKGKKSFFFLQGPPYTSGRIHVGQAWNNSLKDIVLRYKRMCGYDVFDRAGYDMHGLPTETKVMKKHNLAHKDEIKDFGYEKFAQECLDFCKTHAEFMNEDFKRLGVTLDFTRPYMPISREFINGVWWLIKRLHENGRLYEGLRTVYWDWMHETALSKHELEYKTVTDESIFVKFPLKNDPNTSLLIWTTTPWTIPFNLAVMVNPDVEYVYADVTHQGKKQTWIVAAPLAGLLIPQIVDEPFTVQKKVLGEKLKGLKYIHPFQNEMKNVYAQIKSDALHTVVLSEKYVDTSAGTGLVHCAPGCGPEDYEVGHQVGLPPLNLLNERGIYPTECGTFAGRSAIPDNKKFITDLKENGSLVHTTPIEHEYPHAQRSGAPVCFRATKQWFWKVEDLKPRMIEENNKTNWIPQSGFNSFSKWLENLRDNSISKQRLWGTPLPVWRNIQDESDYLVIGSVEELEELSGKKNIEPHKPWVDDITLTKNGKTYKRVVDVLDVWIDAGCASWNALDFPQRKDLFEKLFPADFICEGADQIRGWFNLLMVSSIAAFDKPAFKNVYMHGMVTDIGGVKMSKSLGNIISPYEIMDKYGADTLRYYFSKANPGEDMNFSWDELKQHYRNLSILYNTVNYLIDLAKTTEVTPITVLSGKLKVQKLGQEEQYILSRLSTTIEQITKAYDQYQLNELSPLFESFMLELSRTYIQLVREKSQDDEVVVHTLYNCVYKLLIMAHPIVPFVTEHLYQKLKTAFANDDCVYESLSHIAWNTLLADLKIDAELESQFEYAADAIQSILAAREKLNYGVRWPLASVTIVPSDDVASTALKNLTSLIQSQTNVKQLKFEAGFAVSYKVKPVYRNLKELGQLTATVGKFLETYDKADEMVAAFEQRKPYVVKIGSDEVTIKQDYVEVEKVVPQGVVSIDFKGATVYATKETTPQLELEGYARELMRRIQALRKEQGLQKIDSVILSIKLSAKLQEAFDTHKQLFLAKCGVKKVEALTQSQVEGDIKGEAFALSVKKI